MIYLLKYLLDLEIYNKSKNHADFPMALKLADVIPVHKKDEKNIMKNYRPISLLPIISKLYEKIMLQRN